MERPPRAAGGEGRAHAGLVWKGLERRMLRPCLQLAVSPGSARAIVRFNGGSAGGSCGRVPGRSPPSGEPKDRCWHQLIDTYYPLGRDTSRTCKRSTGPLLSHAKLTVGVSTSMTGLLLFWHFFPFAVTDPFEFSVSVYRRRRLGKTEAFCVTNRRKCPFFSSIWRLPTRVRRVRSDLVAFVSTAI